MSFDIYEEVTTRIIKQLENGVIPWHKPWKTSGINIKGETDLRKVAFNRVTRTAYSFLNQMLLSRAGEYATFKQWADLGGKIKKGAKAEIVVFWKQYETKTKETKDDGTEEEKISKIPLLRYYQVFHIEDVDGVEPLKFEEVIEPTEFTPAEQAEELMTTYSERENVKIFYGGDSAFYSPARDIIQLPQRLQFGKKSGEFYSTAFHEIVHSTGNQKRLDRLEPSFFGSESYSKEELVAEIGAAGILNLLNIETEKTFTNSTAYIQSWVKALKNDKKMIVQASSKAEKAVKYILVGKEENNEGAA